MLTADCAKTDPLTEQLAPTLTAVPAMEIPANWVKAPLRFGRVSTGRREPNRNNAYRPRVEEGTQKTVEAVTPPWSTTLEKAPVVKELSREG